MFSGAVYGRMRACPARRTLVAAVRWAGGTDTIIAALDHAIIDLPGGRGLAELAVVRRNLQGRAVRVWTVDGSQLDVDEP